MLLARTEAPASTHNGIMIQFFKNRLNGDIARKMADFQPALLFEDAINTAFRLEYNERRARSEVILRGPVTHQAFGLASALPLQQSRGKSAREEHDPLRYPPASVRTVGTTRAVATGRNHRVDRRQRRLG
jgi:hypothetical protein